MSYHEDTFEMAQFRPCPEAENKRLLVVTEERLEYTLPRLVKNNPVPHVSH